MRLRRKVPILQRYILFSRLNVLKYGLWYIVNGMLVSSKAREIWMMRAYRFYLFTIAFVILAFTMMTLSVNATERRRLQYKDAYYEEMEDCYVEELREALAKEGYRNAGITMTKVFFEDGQREYTVKLHHKRMEKLDGQERQELLAELSEIGFADNTCRIYLKFL